MTEHRGPTSWRASLLTPRAGGAVTFERDGLLVVGHDGRIEHAGAFDPAAVRGPLHDRRPALIVPGFVDAHLHFPQTRAVGSATGPLLTWLERTVFPEEARFADQAYAREVGAEFAQRMLAVGTTCAAVYSSSSPGATAACFDALDRAGMRALVGLTLMDQSCPPELAVPRERAIPAARELAQAWHGKDGGRLRFAVTPRFAIACSRELMEDAAQLAADLDLPIQTHVSENPQEGSETLRLHPWGRDYVDVYDRVGLLGPRTILAHAIHFSPAERERVAERGARVAHCPDSNFFLGSGCMRLGEALRHGIEVGLGTDVAAGRSFDVRRTMAHAHDAALVVGDRNEPEQLFELATLGGARALGLGEVTGSLEPGKDADFVLVAASERVIDRGAALSHVAFSADGEGRVIATHVRGEQRWSAA